MELLVGHRYIISLNAGSKTLTYTCEITDFDGSFFSFIDKFNKEYTYNINTIISIEEIKK